MKGDGVNRNLIDPLYLNKERWDYDYGMLL